MVENSLKLWTMEQLLSEINSIIRDEPTEHNIEWKDIYREILRRENEKH